MKKWMFSCWAFLLIGLTACENEANTPLKLNISYLEMHYNDSETLILSFGDDSYAEMEYTWSSSDEKVATVSQLGVVSGVTIGECTITVSSTNQYYKANCEVHVLPLSEMYNEPVLNFGSAPEYIKTHETRVLEEETDRALIYQDENKEIKNIIYSFEEDQLINIEVLFHTNTSGLRDEIMTYLEERYGIPDDTHAGYRIFEVEPEKKQAVFKISEPDRLSVSYIRYQPE